MAFWGAEIKNGKSVPFVPPPEAGCLRITQATLGLEAAKNERVALKCKIGNEEVVICSLREGASESTSLDIMLDQYAELSVQSSNQKTSASIHVAGYHVPDEPQMLRGDDDDEEEEDEDIDDLDFEESLQGLPPSALQKLLQLRAMQNGDDEDDSDEDEMMEDSDDDSEEEAPNNKPSVIIEEITEEEDKADPTEVPIVTEAAAKKIANSAVKEAAKKFADLEGDDVSDDEDDELDSKDMEEIEELEGESEDDSDSEEDDEEEQPKAANGKRKAEAAVAPAAAVDVGAAKAAKKAAKKEAKKQAQVEEVAPPAKKAKQDTPSAPAASAEKPLKGIKKFPNGFIIENVSMGDPTGKIAKGGKKVVVKYTGKLAKTGKIFDQTKGNKTFSFRLGVGEVIRGWDEGVIGMRCGDKRKLTVPANMAYGSKGIKGAIPPNSTLIFDVELIDVKG